MLQTYKKIPISVYICRINSINYEKTVSFNHNTYSFFKLMHGDGPFHGD